jgi:hypothetical protein
VRWTLRLRQVANWANLSTPAGLAVARLGRATVAPGPDGLLIATHYRLWARAPAFTIGNVVLLRAGRELLDRRPALLVHEGRHASQYAWLLGVVVMAPLYGVAMLWSWVLAGDFSSYNPFERLAGLADGGYPPARSRWSRRTTP